MSVLLGVLEITVAGYLGQTERWFPATSLSAVFHPKDGSAEA